ncbi:hypothetical protein [Natrialba taiwanensis]|uniref:Uncharacterized protein n=1 Tax=Natrialba taiwanensis DSM 12281 TaxID=1230458 RepID=M0ADR6_9EURY|nr:hypothetical protein [Natrialba taiwanensis]ELY96526.1 hypothetical protein C484_00835 [Natrialba taiwanensis DSM 12281]
MSADGTEREGDLLDWWECASCGETGRNGIPQCPSCGSMQIGLCPDGVDLPPCWTESAADAAALGVDRLFFHLDGPGFIGIDGDEAELVGADLKAGEEPDPETRRATGENVRELAETYNDEFYGENNRALRPDTDRGETA